MLTEGGSSLLSVCFQVPPASWWLEFPDAPRTSPIYFLHPHSWNFAHPSIMDSYSQDHITIGGQPPTTKVLRHSLQQQGIWVGCVPDPSVGFRQPIDDEWPSVLRVIHPSLTQKVRKGDIHPILYVRSTATLHRECPSRPAAAELS